MQLQIPKFFWYALSVCMLSVTGGFLWIAIRASQVSVEIASTKINLANAATDLRSVYHELETREQELNAAKKTIAKMAEQANLPRPQLPDVSLDTATKDRVKESLNMAQQQIQKKD